MNKLFVFGDSWPQGSELKPGEKTFGEIVANNLGFDFDNRAQPSTSIPHLILQLKEVIDNANFLDMYKDQSFFLFFLSSPLRDLYWHNGKTMELEPAHPEDADWYVKFHSQELAEYRVNTSLLALQHLITIYKIPSFFVWGWEKVDLWKEVDTSHFYPISCAEMFTDNYTTFQKLQESKNRYIWPNFGHPNQLGHQLIADNLTKFLKQKLTQS